MSTLVHSLAEISSKPLVLEAIKDPSISLAVWERPAPSGIEALLLDELSDIRFAAPLEDFAARLSQEMSRAGFDLSSVEGTQLQRDIGELVLRFCSVMRCQAVDMRLEVVATDACRKFHGDYVQARLITTYVGEGTQWLDRDDAARVGEGLEPREIRQMAPGDVGMFKGKLASEWPAIHRSPPIESTLTKGIAQKRLLLVLNPSE